MSKKFLSPIKHAQGATLPATGTAGEQFYRTTDQTIYTHNGTAWTSAGAPNTFSTIAVSGQSNVVADSSSDTLTLTANSGISLGTNATTDTVFIGNTASTTIGTTFSGTYTRTNLATNPSFESGTTPPNSGFGSQFALSTAQAYVGTTSLFASTASTNYYTTITGDSSTITFESGRAYTLSFYIKLNDSLMTIQIGRSGGSVNPTSTVNYNSTEWQRVHYTWVQGVGFTPTVIGFLVGKNGTGGYLDAILIEQTPLVLDYFDGANGGGSWSGMANASTSTRLTPITTPQLINDGSALNPILELYLPSSVSQTNGTVTTADTSLGVVRNIYTSTSNPTGGMDGDIWMVYS